MKTTSRTEKKSYAFESARRCGARTKSNNGKPCRCPAIRGKARCRVHGGAKGSGAPPYNLNALKHGEHTAEAKAFRNRIRRAIQWSNHFLDEFD
ncbi:HGGxSTG domain-containing protein [Legionella sp. 29fVS95]|uniref:HGGxSTG domain-containing protein n=1 Tax=Legionella sp. 29fVS95 TaxID=3402813 RepID=UPI003AF4236C